MTGDHRLQPVTSNEYSRIMRVFWIGLTLRLALATFLQITGVEKSLKLTKDAFLYDQTGKAIAEYYRTNGGTSWPARTTSVFNHFYEYFVGITYYFTDDSMFVVRVINVIAGSLVILATWRMARYITLPETAFRCGLWACFFPTQLYYSCLPVRDAHSTLAMTLIFLGMTAMTSSGKTRHVLALPVGLLLTAGFRTYVATVLVILIPIGWLATFLLVRSRGKSLFVGRVAVVAAIALALFGPTGAEKIFSIGKASQVTDIDYWNSTRAKMNSGGGALYRDGDVPEIGDSIVGSVQGIAVGLYFFFVSVNPTEMSSVRQWMAIPEVLIVLYMIPKMYRGFRRVLKYHRFQFVSVLFVAAAITFGYSSVTTNAGPLMRWRLQVVNIYIVVAAIGFSRNYDREFSHAGSVDSGTSGMSGQPSTDLGYRRSIDMQRRTAARV